MANEDECRFYIGDEVRVRTEFAIPEMRAEVLTAIGVVGDVADRRIGQTVTVMYRGLGFCAANISARTFELVRRGQNRRPDMPLPRWFGPRCE